MQIENKVSHRFSIENTWNPRANFTNLGFTTQSRLLMTLKKKTFENIEG